MKTALAIVVAAAILLCMLHISGREAASGMGQAGMEPPPIVIGFSSGTFNYVDRQNTQAVAKLWSDLIFRKRNGKGETYIYQNRRDLEKDLRRGKPDVVVLLCNEYLELKTRSLLEPLFVPARDKSLYEHYILCVRKDSGIRTIRDLRGKSIVRQKGAFSNFHVIWLETLLMKLGVRDGNRYFSDVREVLTSSQTLMPVFFKSADACILVRHSFEVMSELNPQLNRELLVIEESRPLISSVIAIRKGCDSGKRGLIKEILSTLNRDERGRQLLTLFYMGRLVPFEQSYLSNTEDLIREHARLRMGLEKRMP